MIFADLFIQYWDMRTPNAIATAQLAERCYSMDTNWPYVIVATAERKIQVFDLSQNPSNPIMVSTLRIDRDKSMLNLFFTQTMESPLKWQTRVLSCVKRSEQPGLPSVQPGFAVGSVEGRVAFQYIKEADKA